jgi:hypothetical protein
MESGGAVITKRLILRHREKMLTGGRAGPTAPLLQQHLNRFELAVIDPRNKQDLPRKARTTAHRINRRNDICHFLLSEIEIAR